LSLEPSEFTTSSCAPPNVLRARVGHGLQAEPNTQPGPSDLPAVDKHTSPATSAASINFLPPLHNLFAACDSQPEKYFYAPRTDAHFFRYLQPETPFADERGNFAVVDRETFLRNFRALTGGILDCINWQHVVVAGGAVLACLTHPDLTVRVWFE